MAYASTGQLTYSQFEHGLQLFVDWWESAASAAAAAAPSATAAASPSATASPATATTAGGGGGGGCPCWELRHIKLPVTDQVVCYCELERVVIVKPSQTAAGLGTLPVASRDAPAAAVQAAADGNAAAAAEMDAAVASTDAAAAPATSGLPAFAAEVDAAVGRRDAAVAVDSAAAVPAAAEADAAAAVHAAADKNAALAADGDAAVVQRDAAVAADCVAAVPAAAEPDTAEAASAATHAPPQIHQYSIVWHETYQVPVLYIRAFAPDGRCLSLDDLMTDLPGLRDSREPDQADWTFLTAVEHPLTRSPCYMLHPCQTAERMRLMMQYDSSLTAADNAADTAALCSAASVRYRSEYSSCRDSMGVGNEGGPAAKETGSAASDVGVPAASAAAVAKEQLLVYMRGWFSLVAGVLGFSMVRHSFW